MLKQKLTSTTRKINNEITKKKKKKNRKKRKEEIMYFCCSTNRSNERSLYQRTDPQNKPKRGGLPYEAVIKLWTIFLYRISFKL